jgi:hypothetical protein
MTLLAIRGFFGVPVLVADTLVSDKGPGKRRLPTRPPNQLFDAASAPHGYLPSNTYRKVYIVSDNLAVGWAGDMSPAAELLETVFSVFGGTAVTPEDWEKFITSRQCDGGANVVLAGWIIDGDRRLAFRWRSRFPSNLQKDTSTGACFSDGTGADFARRTLGQPATYTTTATKGSDKATLCALDGISNLVAYELADGSNLLELFGLCYELIVFDGTRFFYVDDINYLHYHYRWDADRPERLEGGIIRFRTHYRNLGEYACCSISNHAYDPHVDGFFVIKPVFGEKSQPEWAPAKRIRSGFDAEYFCNFVFVEASDGMNMYSPFVVTRGSPDLPIDYTDEGRP